MVTLDTKAEDCADAAHEVGKEDGDPAGSEPAAAQAGNPAAEHGQPMSKSQAKKKARLERCAGPTSSLTSHQMSVAVQLHAQGRRRRSASWFGAAR